MDGEFCDQIFIFDFSKMLWIPLILPQPSLMPLLSGHTAVFWKEGLYVFGGQHPKLSYQNNELHCFSLKSLSWSIVPTSFEKNSQPGFLFVSSVYFPLKYCLIFFKSFKILDGQICSHTWTLIAENFAVLYGGVIVPESLTETRPINFSSLPGLEQKLNNQLYVFNFENKFFSPLV